MATFYIDHNVSLPTAHLLRARGHDAVAAKGWRLERSKDDEQLLTAAQARVVNPWSWLLRRFRAAGSEVGISGLKTGPSRSLSALNRPFFGRWPHFCLAPDLPGFGRSGAPAAFDGSLAQRPPSSPPSSRRSTCVCRSTWSATTSAATSGWPERSSTPSGCGASRSPTPTSSRTTAGMGSRACCRPRCWGS